MQRTYLQGSGVKLHIENDQLQSDLTCTCIYCNLAKSTIGFKQMKYQYTNVNSKWYNSNAVHHGTIKGNNLMPRSFFSFMYFFLKFISRKCICLSPLGNHARLNCAQSLKKTH